MARISELGVVSGTPRYRVAQLEMRSVVQEVPAGSARTRSSSARALGSNSSEPRCVCHGVTEPAHVTQQPSYADQSIALQQGRSPQSQPAAGLRRKRLAHGEPARTPTPHLAAGPLAPALRRCRAQRSQHAQHGAAQMPRQSCALWRYVYSMVEGPRGWGTEGCGRGQGRGWTAGRGAVR